MTLPVSTADLEKTAFSLVASAIESSAVARLSLDNDLTMFAYPGVGFVVVGIGYQRDRLRPGMIENILKRRFQVPSRFAQWIPAQFADGSFFLLLRIQHNERDIAPSPSETALGNAIALLAP